MRARFALVVASVALFTVVTCASARADDRADITALEKTFTTAFKHKDVDAIMRVYAPGKSLFAFDFIGPPSTYVGSDAYRGDWKGFFASFSGPVTFSLRDFDVAISGDVAYGHSLQHFIGRSTADGKKTDIVVRVTDVYRKIGAKWLIVQEHVSVPLDVKTMAPVLR
ncbi:MAG: hypothetical protein NVSMB64_03740 [Candidatus Velthaea sp.]